MAKQDWMKWAFGAVIVLLAVMIDASQTHLLFKGQQLSVNLNNAGTSVVTGVPSGSTTGLYDYANVQPKIVLSSQDAIGNAVNPTVYFYPSTACSGTNWGKERTFTDSAGSYSFTSTMANGSTSTTNYKPGEAFCYHAKLASYADVFGNYSVPIRGDMTPGDAASVGFQISMKEPAWDTTAWVSAAQSMGFAASNLTNTEKKKIISYVVADNKAVQLSQATIDEVRSFSQEGIHRVALTIEDAHGHTYSDVIYDYGAGTKRYGYISSSQPAFYDTNDYADAKNDISALSNKAGEPFTLTFDVFADTIDYAGTVGDGKLNNTETILKNFNLYDVEGNALITNRNVTA